MNKLLDLYSDTQFMVKDHEGNLVYFTVNTAKDFPVLKKKSFAVITAWNPHNRALSILENNVRNEALRKDITQSSHYFYPSAGTLGDHTEDSFTIEGISEKDATALGKKYDQHAILFNDIDGLRFVFPR